MKELEHLVSLRVKRLDDCIRRVQTLSEAESVARLRVVWYDLLSTDSLPDRQVVFIDDYDPPCGELEFFVYSGEVPWFFYVTGSYNYQGGCFAMHFGADTTNASMALDWTGGYDDYCRACMAYNLWCQNLSEDFVGQRARSIFFSYLIFFGEDDLIIFGEDFQ